MEFSPYREQAPKNVSSIIIPQSIIVTNILGSYLSKNEEKEQTSLSAL